MQPCTNVLQVSTRRLPPLIHKWTDTRWNWYGSVHLQIVKHVHEITHCSIAPVVVLKSVGLSLFHVLCPCRQICYELFLAEGSAKDATNSPGDLLTTLWVVRTVMIRTMKSFLLCNIQQVHIFQQLGEISLERWFKYVPTSPFNPLYQCGIVLQSGNRRPRCKHSDMETVCLDNFRAGIPCTRSYQKNIKKTLIHNQVVYHRFTILDKFTRS